MRQRFVRSCAVASLLCLACNGIIAADGERSPAVDKSQRQFNTGMVMVVQHGAKPSNELFERTTGIRKQWIEYFSITTGRRASMTANPN